MKSLIRSIFLFIAFISFSSFSYSETIKPTSSSATCSFDKHSAAKPPSGSAADYTKGAIYMTFVDGKTNSKTSKLDGSIRATNSKNWYQIKSDYSGVSFMGDAGELLVIWTTPKDNVGIFNASFQWSSKDTYAFTSLGKCSFER